MMNKIKKLAYKDILFVAPFSLLFGLYSFIFFQGYTWGCVMDCDLDVITSPGYSFLFPAAVVVVGVSLLVFLSKLSTNLKATFLVVPITFGLTFVGFVVFGVVDFYVIELAALSIYVASIYHLYRTK